MYLHMPRGGRRAAPPLGDWATTFVTVAGAGPYFCSTAPPSLSSGTIHRPALGALPERVNSGLRSALWPIR